MSPMIDKPNFVCYNRQNDMGRRTAMLNEKSGIWIKLYKLCIIIIFILCFPGCFFLGTLLRLTGFSYFCCIFLGLFVGILQWILNMLILNLVSNLQILREIEDTELCFCLSCMRSQQLLKLCFSQRTLPHHHLNTVLAAAPGRFVNRRIQSI